ncbi:MAG: hypothetical protein H9W81_02535 [Enterococcus sp.]|nr:hypothetical protein [Enterococcus sp.]
MSTTVYVATGYGVILDIEDEIANDMESRQYAEEYYDAKLIDEYSGLTLMEGRGMYDDYEDVRHIIALKDTVTKVNEDNGVTPLNVTMPSAENIELVKRFVRDELGFEPDEPRWHLTIRVS